MIDQELIDAYRKKYNDALHLRLLDHAVKWNQTLRNAPEGWSPTSCAAYRMAMESALSILVDEDKLEEENE